MFKHKKISLAVWQALTLGVAASVSASAMAQIVTMEKIEVTGTRIPAPNLEGPSPVTVITADDIKIEGVRSVENLLNNLPQVMADQGATISNGSTGTATVNLRGLGPTRTLVLVNGRRVPAGSPFPGGSAADLNQIPAPLIQRVEILTGGAGAVYGSDAVAGVVNFIMNDKFEGVQLEVNESFYNHKQQNPNGIADIINGRAAANPSQFTVPGNKESDGKIYDANILMGSNFANGKGNGTVYFGYKKEEALLQAARDFSACALGSGASGFSCSGSSTSFPGRFYNLDTGASYTVANAAGNTRAFSSSLDQYNFAPLNYFQRPSERYSVSSFVNYDVSDKAKIYSEFSFHDDHTVAQIAPSGSFFGGNTYTLAFANPLLSADWRQALGLLQPGDTRDVWIGRRNLEGGGRQDDIRHTSFREVLGVKGEFAPGWTYDAFMQTSKVLMQEIYRNDFSNARTLNALDVVTGPNGTPVCRSVVNGTDPNCVPYNIFALGGVTPAALNYLQTPGFQNGSTEQTVQGINVSVDLGTYGVKLPSAKNGIEANMGLERRVEKLRLETDMEFSTGDLAGQGGPRIGTVGQYTVQEIFGELRAPLIEGMPFAHLLSVNGSARYSDYSTDQKATSFGLGLEWAPVQTIRTRGSYQRAVRAANVHELFDQQAVGLYNNSADPCAGATPTATLAQCQRTGVTAAQYGNILDSPAGQYNALFGGNTSLKPEKSDSYTIGLVIEPMRNMSATIDYGNIKVKDAISTLPPNIVLQQCLDSGQFCNLITRDRAGTLWASPTAQIVATNINIASLKTSGIDIGFNYRQGLTGLGSIAFNFIGTYLLKAESEPIPGLGTYDCVGLHGAVCGVPSPQWRHKARTTWTTPWNFDLALTWRHIDSVKNEATSSNPMLSAPIESIDSTLGARDYFDLAGSWNVTKQLTLRGGINNILDKDPPVVNYTTTAAGFGNGNTYPQVYDALGRRVFLNATYKF
jgi:iron complex outermembrane receptor protein